MDQSITRRKPRLRPLRPGVTFTFRYICWCNLGAGYGITAKEAYDNWQEALR